MKIEIYADAVSMGRQAAKAIARKLNRAIVKQGSARLLLSTGASQFTMFDDEYISRPVTHIASFRKYLTERFISKVNLRAAYLIDGEGDITAIAASLKSTLAQRAVDVGVVGIGENGHIAFNDPPADFETQEAYIAVNLDDRCKAQQVREGWFENTAAVPDRALSMSVSQIMKCRSIISVVPHAVKAEAVYNTLTMPVTDMVPATILKTHPDWILFLDAASASKVAKL
jgi:glucosamine-6-phosphate deaminase